MNHTFLIKHFSELTSIELYQVLQLRQDVFIIEQNCIYPDIDSVDLTCYHLLMTNNMELIGYCRVIEPGVKYPASSIGRVVIKPFFRGNKLGYPLMNQAINYCLKKWTNSGISISAQAHLKEFYARLGFVKKGEIYDEDGIPHIKMEFLLE